VERMALPRITWHDVQQLPDDGKRYEAIEGDLYVTPAPSVRHQSISGNLYVKLRAILVDGGHGRLWYAPTGVEFPATGEGVQSDLLFVSHARQGIVADDWLHGAPDLIVEILSPATADRDRGIKHRLYERQGVAEYWIVDPDAEAVEVWRFGQVPRHERHTKALPVRLGEETLGKIELSEVFARD